MVLQLRSENKPCHQKTLVNGINIAKRLADLKIILFRCSQILYQYHNLVMVYSGFISVFCLRTGVWNRLMDYFKWPLFLIFGYLMKFYIEPLPINLKITALFTLSSVSLVMLVAGTTVCRRYNPYIQ